MKEMAKKSATLRIENIIHLKTVTSLHEVLFLF